MGTVERINKGAAKAIFNRNALNTKLEAARLQLEPFYEDGEGTSDELDAAIEAAKRGDKGAVGIMSAIAWCWGELGVYHALNSDEE